MIDWTTSNCANQRCTCTVHADTATNSFIDRDLLLLRPFLTLTFSTFLRCSFNLFFYLLFPLTEVTNLRWHFFDSPIFVYLNQEYMKTDTKSGVEALAVLRLISLWVSVSMVTLSRLGWMCDWVNVACVGKIFYSIEMINVWKIHVWWHWGWLTHQLWGKCTGFYTYFFSLHDSLKTLLQHTHLPIYAQSEPLLHTPSANPGFLSIRLH